MRKTNSSILLICVAALLIQDLRAAEADSQTFHWPEGRLGAVTLSYDDAIPSHFRQVAPALERANLRGTFYITVGSPAFKAHVDAWRKVAEKGHELGNHSLFHPCRKDRPGQHEWLSDDYNLSQYSPERWLQEMSVANLVLELVDGKTERTFGNTCCNNSLGPLENQTSLELLIPNLFVAGRGEFNRTDIEPTRANMRALGHYGADGRTFEALRAEIEAAIEKGNWVFYMIHGVGKGTHNLYIEPAEHQKLLDYLDAHRDRIWTAPAIAIAKYIQQFSLSTNRPAPMIGESTALPCILKARPLVVQPPAKSPFLSPATSPMVSWYLLGSFSQLLTGS